MRCDRFLLLLAVWRLRLERWTKDQALVEDVKAVLRPEVPDMFRQKLENYLGRSDQLIKQSQFDRYPGI